MKHHYRFRYLLLTGALWLLAGAAAWAQPAPPFGNEWIVPSQQYYKIKITKDGLYRLDQQYLAQAGISGVNPQRIQLWRRGREVAIYGGGNQTTFDATTYFEFYGQRNDGKLDQAIYKGGAATQPHDLYSLYTDTAAYFLTWSATANGKRMTQPTAPTGPTHTLRMAQRQQIYGAQLLPNGALNGRFAYVNDEPYVNVYQPWGEAGEGFLSVPFAGDNSNSIANIGVDSVTSVSATGRNPEVELLLVGSGSNLRTVNIFVVEPGTTPTERLLGSMTVVGYGRSKQVFPLRRTDISASGGVTIYSRGASATTDSRKQWYRVGYIRVRFPQTSEWSAARGQVFFSNDSTLAGPAHYEFDNIPAGVRGYDVTDPYNVQRVEGAAGAGQQRRYGFASATNRTRQLLLADAAQAPAPRPAVRVRFPALPAGAANFVVVTHPKLMRPTNGVPNPTRAYASYRASAAGGRYDTLVVNVEQLYDQFHYGEKSVAGLRNFVLWKLANSPANQTSFLLLLGKGLMPGEYVRAYPLPDTDLIPVSTRGASDNFLSADWQNDNYVARMATGRVSAVDGAEVLRYLAKLRTHEALGPEAWRKNILHLAGGKDQSEFTQFEGYLAAYERLAERPLFGGRVVKTYKRSDAGGSGDLPISITIAPEVNQGVSLVSYFGHGSATDFDLNFGDPTEPIKGYNNPNKYPVFLINGCAANFIFGNYRALSEKWVLTENKGALGFLAESSLGFSNNLNTFSSEFYRLAFNEPAWYGKPVTVLQLEATRRMLAQVQQGNNAAIAQALTTIWQGDPALRLYAPERPDFVTGNDSLQIQPNGGPGPVRASSPSFKLAVRVGNAGKITADSVDIQVTRRYPVGRGRQADVLRRTVRQAWQDTTYTFVFNNTGDVNGENCFEVVLDYRNRVNELSEANNTGQLCYNFLQGGVATVWPPEFAIVSATGLRLVGQSNDPRGQSRGYEMELDTVPTFNSPLKQARTLTATIVPDWRPTLPTLAGRDSVVWYWRLRFQTPAADESAAWATSSFRVIPGSSGGWSQSHHGQFKRNQLRNVDVAAPSGRWSFADIRQPVTLITRGGGPAGSGPTFSVATDGITAASTSATGDCATNMANIIVAVFNGRTLRQVRNVGGGPYDSCGQASLRYYHFATSRVNDVNTPARQAQLEALLTNVRPGDYVALISMNRVAYSTWPASLRAAFASLGAQRISSLQDGDPYALLAQKGPGGRAVQELTADPNSPTPRNQQSIVLNAEMSSRAGRGTITSALIGPAQQWQTLYHTVRTPEAADQYRLRLLGIDSVGNATVLNPNVTSRALALGNFSARRYPRMQLELELRDTVNLTAPQLEQWLVTYLPVPEGIVRRDLATPATAYDPATLQQQATTAGKITVPVVFQNVSSVDFGGPMKARIYVRDGGNRVFSKFVDVPGGPLRADSQVSFSAELNVVGALGTIAGGVEVNPRLRPATEPRALPEQDYSNNELLLDPFQIDDRNTPPTLDVAFDGRRILNGDFVSPAPRLTVQMKDDDRLRRIQGRDNFSLFLTAPNQTSPVAVDLSNATFTADSTKGVARLEVQLGQNQPLPDGTYTLEVQGRDATQKAAAENEYRVSFEVTNASTITNLFPYPNPVTSKTRFVFTLTGAELPRNLKIQIMSLTGRVVKEIMMDELGPLHIGSNITEYAWDGTDSFGDRLANGTYLYRVILDDPGSKFTRRTTGGDRAFKKDWGKLVLLR